LPVMLDEQPAAVAKVSSAAGSLSEGERRVGCICRGACSRSGPPPLPLQATGRAAGHQNSERNSAPDYLLAASATSEFKTGFAGHSRAGGNPDCGTGARMCRNNGTRKNKC
jgi:hypothetical protein